MAFLSIGNILCVNYLSEVKFVSNCQAKIGDRSSVAKASGFSAIIVEQSNDGKKTKVRLPSGTTVTKSFKGIIGLVAGGGRTVKPIAKPVTHTTDGK